MRLRDHNCIYEGNGVGFGNQKDYSRMTISKSFAQAFEAIPKLEIRKRTDSTDLTWPPTQSFLPRAVKLRSSPGL
jgi:hypothetical protein